MEIFTLLETLEDILERSKKLPFSYKVIVDGNEILDLIKEIRLKLPDELKQAKWIKEERERIMAEAHKDADDIVKEAEKRIISMIDEHEITKKAYDKKDEIISEANEKYRIMDRETKAYADGILGNVQQEIKSLQEVLIQIEGSLNETVQNLENDRKELK
ncbi:MAG: ATPase [Clostridia bacterium]|nr:ATPase [Clostridia bacterium]